MSALSAVDYSSTPVDEIRRSLMTRGWVLLRDEGYTLQRFSELMHQLCDRLTFDPAREFVSRQAQKVDAGNAAVGLHIENGNTPLPPDIVAFYSDLSAEQGSETTFCDGALVYRNLPAHLREQFSQPITATRFLPRPMWQRYVATALGLAEADGANLQHLQQFIDALPGQAFSPARDGGIDYTLTIAPLREDNLVGIPSFANALLGPSYNYEAPVYRFANGETVDRAMLLELADLCEPFTRQLAWRDGDVLLLDNKRFMHGRRCIPVSLNQRRLYIGMGLGLRTRGTPNQHHWRE